MGACCTKFGSYLLRKEESKVLSNGGTPKLINKLEHKQSFVVSHTTYEEKPSAENILPSPDEKIDLSPQHHEDKLQPNKDDEDSNSKENSETEVKVVTGAAIKGVIRSNSKSSSSSSSSDNDSLENGTTSKNDQTVCQESDIKQDLAEIPRSLTQDVVETNELTETPTPENKEVDKSSSSSSEDENTAEASEKLAEPETVTVTVVESTESVNDPESETKSISSKNSSSSDSEDENNIPKVVEPEGEVASIKSDKESNSSRKSSTSETEINDEPEPEKKASQISSESPVPEITVTEYTTDEPEVEKLPSEESSKSTSSSSSSSSSESEEEPIDEAPHELPDHNTHNKTEDQEVESSEPEDKRDLTNGESVETPYVAETENNKISEKADSESESSSSSSDDHDEEDNEEEIVHTQAAENLSKAEVQKSYAQLITPSGFNPGAGLEVANDNVPEEANESDHDLM